MSTSPRHDQDDNLPTELHNGDRMNRFKFHAVYENMPEDFRAPGYQKQPIRMDLRIPMRGCPLSQWLR
jgi:hypothetical protein